MSISYGMYIYDNVANLDYIGAHEAFGISLYLLGEGKLFTVAEYARPITSATGLQVVPDYTFENAPDVDVLLVPGAMDLDSALKSTKALNWIKKVSQTAKYTTAVCTGALILQKAELLKNKKATTHWQLIPELQKDESVTVLPDMRYVRDGNIVTAQGVSAGIDMALWLLGQLHTHDHAREVRRILQYDPAPPYTAEV